MAEILQFSAQKSAGKIAQIESEVAASQIELGAVSREADRKGRLARALASQTASAGSKGISAFEGSPLSVLEADIQAEKTGTERDVFSSELESMTTRARGVIARKQASAGATIGLLTDIQSKAKKAATAGPGG